MGANANNGHPAAAPGEGEEGSLTSPLTVKVEMSQDSLAK